MQTENKNNIFDEISRYWSAEINNENYLLVKKNLPFERGTKAYFDYLINQHQKYVYYFDRIVEYFRQASPSSERPKLLEIGCGIGLDLVRLAELDYDCYGVDLADKHIELANQVFQQYHRQAVIKKGNAEQLEFPDEHFDAIYSNGVLHHTQNPQRAVHEIYRVMKLGGRGFVMLYAKYSLNNLAHFITKKPFENAGGSNPVARDAHFVYRYSIMVPKNWTGL